MPTKKRKKAYGPGGNYYRQRITRPDGSKEDVYARTLTELTEQVQRRKDELAAGSVPPREMFVYEYAAAYYARRAPHLSEGQKSPTHTKSTRSSALSSATSPWSR